MNGQDFELRRKVKILKEDAHTESIEMRAELLLHLSKISRLEGLVKSLLEDAQSKAKSIQKLQDKQSKLDGLRSNLS